jgi:hypothetical protein
VLSMRVMIRGTMTVSIRGTVSMVIRGTDVLFVVVGSAV